MRIETRQAFIESILRQNKDLFEYVVKPKIFQNPKGGGRVFFPHDKVSMKKVEGSPLKNNAGFIAIQEDVEEGFDSPTTYRYKFSTDRFEYKAEKKGEGESPKIFFNFHYEKEYEEEPHVSFLHHSIKFFSRRIDLEDFLRFIRRTIFDDDGKVRSSCPWDNRL